LMSLFAFFLQTFSSHELRNSNRANSKLWLLDYFWSLVYSL